MEAFDRLLSRGPVRDAWPWRVVIRRPNGDTDVWPAFVAALANMSGWLEEAATPEQLNAAIQHGWSLVNCGVFRLADVRHECDEIIWLVRDRFERVCSFHDPAFLKAGRLARMQATHVNYFI